MVIFFELAAGSSGSRLTINRWPSRVFAIDQIPPPFSVPIQVYTYGGRSSPGINLPVSGYPVAIANWYSIAALIPVGRPEPTSCDARRRSSTSRQPERSFFYFPRLFVCYCRYAHSQRIVAVFYHDGSSGHPASIAVPLSRRLGEHHQWRGGRRIWLDLYKLPAGAAQQHHRSCEPHEGCVSAPTLFLKRAIDIRMYWSLQVPSTSAAPRLRSPWCPCTVVTCSQVSLSFFQEAHPHPNLLTNVHSVRMTC